MTLAMYPDYPESPSDLVPLPLCDGPKLEPFDFQGPQEIEFLEYLGYGAHSHVVRVKIHGKIYALKLFRFVCEDLGPISWNDYPKDRETQTAFAEYCEPFYAECRAFGRLKEAGHEDLAIGCFGYILLSDENEAAVMAKFKDKKLSFDGDGGFDGEPGSSRGDSDSGDDFLGEMYSVNGDDSDGEGGSDAKAPEEEISWRARFTGKGEKPPPVRGILKEFGQEQHRMTNKDFKDMRRVIMSLQKLGIARLDIHPRQFVSGRLADLSLAYTTRHFALNPELNELLTADEASWVDFEAFRVSVTDYWMFDSAVFEYNHDKWYADVRRGEIRARGIPGSTHFPRRYSLRRKPDREGFYTYVDMRSYDWRTMARVDGERPGGGVVRARARLRRVPPRWHYRTDDAKKVAKLKSGRQHLGRQLFQFRDELFFTKEVLEPAWKHRVEDAVEGYLYLRSA